MLIPYLNWLKFLHYLINFPVVVNKVSNQLKNKPVCNGFMYHGILSQNRTY